jgi:uncharacterized protein (TIGR00251 family)
LFVDLRFADLSVDLEIRVMPRAGRSGFGGWREGVLIVKLAAAPVDGAANDELIALLAKTLHVPKRDITILSGERSRNKRVRIAGIEQAQALAKLIPDP